MCRWTLAAGCLLVCSLEAQIPQKSDSADGHSAAAETRTCDASLIGPNILSDQKTIWTFPAQVARGKHLGPTIGFLAITAALIATDSRSSSYFRGTSSFKSFNSGFNGTATALATALAPVPFYVAGVIRSNSKAKTTTWLSGEALADSEIVAFAMKSVDRRLRPASFPQRTDDMYDTWEDASGPASGSFPSAHTIAAFSVATIVSSRYRTHRWVPFVAYGLATAVGFSRLTTSAHYPSDVFVGAVLGYSISRFVVLRQ